MSSTAAAPVSHEKQQIVPASFAQRQQMHEGGCFRDIGQIRLAADGSFYVLEWTPTLNAVELPVSDLLKLIADCQLDGGGWSAPTVDEIETLRDLTQYNPATFAELKADTKSDWYLTSDKPAWSPGHVWFVNFDHGVGLWYDFVVSRGFARGVRRVAVSPGQ